MTTPTDADFRAVGFTAAARNYPLSASACAVISELNGVAVGKMPAAWRYAPNAHMRDWMEWLGAERAAGRPIRDGDRVRHGCSACAPLDIGKGSPSTLTGDSQPQY